MSLVAVSQTRSGRNIMWGTDGNTDQEVPLESHTQNTNSRISGSRHRMTNHGHMKKKSWQVYKNTTESGYVCNLQCVMSLVSSCKHQQSKGRTASLAHGEHGHLDCKHFNVQMHTLHFRYTLTFHVHAHMHARFHQKLCCHISKLFHTRAHTHT